MGCCYSIDVSTKEGVKVPKRRTIPITERRTARDVASHARSTKAPTLFGQKKKDHRAAPTTDDHGEGHRYGTSPLTAASDAVSARASGLHPEVQAMRNLQAHTPVPTGSRKRTTSRRDTPPPPAAPAVEPSGRQTLHCPLQPVRQQQSPLTAVDGTDNTRPDADVATVVDDFSDGSADVDTCWAPVDVGRHAMTLTAPLPPRGGAYSPLLVDFAGCVIPPALSPLRDDQQQQVRDHHDGNGVRTPSSGDSLTEANVQTHRHHSELFLRHLKRRGEPAVPGEPRDWAERVEQWLGAVDPSGDISDDTSATASTTLPGSLASDDDDDDQYPPLGLPPFPRLVPHVGGDA